MGGIKLPENLIFRETDCVEENGLTSLSPMCHFPSLFPVLSLPRGQALIGTTHTCSSALLFPDINETRDTWDKKGVSLIYLADAELSPHHYPHLSIQKLLKEMSKLTETLVPQFLPQILSFSSQPKW